jgi:hypothetical protein
MSNNNKNLITTDRKKLLYGGAEAVVSQKFITQINEFIAQSATENCIQDLSIQDTFITKYRQWILSTTLNKVIGLDQFPVAAYTNGTTEGFDKFYLKHKTRRFRCLRGEYMYHMASWKTYCPSWEYIDDIPLDSNDAVIISFPFADLGQEHPRTTEILDQCHSLGIPVLMDCAYFSISKNMIFDFTHPAITDITFSLSKFLPVANLRIGIRFTKIDDDDSLLVINKVLYTNRLGSSVGIKIMNSFNPDYIVTSYKLAQLDLCNKLNIVPSKSVIFGIDFNNNYPEYNRGGKTSRLCLAKYLDLNIP